MLPERVIVLKFQPSGILPCSWKDRQCTDLQIKIWFQPAISGWGKIQQSKTLETGDNYFKCLVGRAAQCIWHLSRYMNKMKGKPCRNLWDNCSQCGGTACSKVLRQEWVCPFWKLRMPICSSLWARGKVLDREVKEEIGTRSQRIL